MINGLELLYQITGECIDCICVRSMDSTEKSGKSSAAESTEGKTTADDTTHTSQSSTEQTYGCSHYQRKCLLVV